MVYEHTLSDIHTSILKILTMFTGELGFESSFVNDTLPNSTLIIFVMFLYVYFVIEMCVILMNLTIGLSISNIQELQKHADGLRMVKEVLLQRYLESLLRLGSIHKPRGQFWSSIHKNKTKQLKSRQKQPKIFEKWPNMV